MTPELKGFLLVSRAQAARGLHDHAGRRGATDADGAEGVRLDAGPARARTGSGSRACCSRSPTASRTSSRKRPFPATANAALFILAPALAFIPALILGSVIPWAAPLPVTFDFTLPLLGPVHLSTALTPMAVADLPVGFLFVLAISSLGVYGIALAGWSSNNKYALLGGLRASAQMISYEVAMGLALVPVLLLTGNVALREIIRRSSRRGSVVRPAARRSPSSSSWSSGFAETNRLPFDLPEAESELVAGYHTEYSAMKFSMFFIAEYANMVTVVARWWRRCSSAAGTSRSRTGTRRRACCRRWRPAS